MSHEQIAEHHYETPHVVPVGKSHEFHIQEIPVQDRSEKQQTLKVLRRAHEVVGNLKTGFNEQGRRDAGVLLGHESHDAHNAAIGANTEELSQSQVARAISLNQDHEINKYNLN